MTYSLCWNEVMVTRSWRVVLLENQTLISHNTKKKYLSEYSLLLMIILSERCNPTISSSGEEVITVEDCFVQFIEINEETRAHRFKLIHWSRNNRQWFSLFVLFMKNILSSFIPYQLRHHETHFYAFHHSNGIKSSSTCNSYKFFWIIVHITILFHYPS